MEPTAVAVKKAVCKTVPGANSQTKAEMSCKIVFDSFLWPKHVAEIVLTQAKKKYYAKFLFIGN
jgi:hypothetical protein